MICVDPEKSGTIHIIQRVSKPMGRQASEQTECKVSLLLLQQALQALDPINPAAAAYTAMAIDLVERELAELHRAVA